MFYVKKGQRHDTLSLTSQMSYWYMLAHTEAYDDYVLQSSQSSNLVRILILLLIQLNLDPNHASDPTLTRTQL